MNYRLLKMFGLGIGSALVAMALFPVIAKAARPLVKSIIKGGFNLKEQMKEAYAESKEKIEDIMAEVKEEMDEKES